jgi:hypothetical protein
MGIITGSPKRETNGINRDRTREVCAHKGSISEVAFRQVSVSQVGIGKIRANSKSVYEDTLRIDLGEVGSTHISVIKFGTSEIRYRHSAIGSYMGTKISTRQNGIICKKAAQISATKLDIARLSWFEWGITQNNITEISQVKGRVLQGNIC